MLTKPHEKIEPNLPSEQVLNIPIKRLLGTHDGGEGAYYESFGIEFVSGDTLYLCYPNQDYQRTAKTRDVEFLHDLSGEPISEELYLGLTLKNLIYFKMDIGNKLVNHYLAVLDNGAYITSYVAFNCNEFAFARFSDWGEEDVSMLSLVGTSLKKMTYYNAWNHSRIDPFRVYKLSSEKILKYMSRYLIVGCSGSGKSTLARKVSKLRSVPHIDTDNLYWNKDWGIASDREVIDQLPLDDDQWVLDGNFVGNRAEVWSRATSIIWIDPPKAKVMYRLSKRNLGWWLFRKSSWTENRMPFKIALSGIIHGWKRFGTIQESYPKFMDEYSDKRIHRIRSKSEYDAFVDY